MVRVLKDEVPVIVKASQRALEKQASALASASGSEPSSKKNTVVPTLEKLDSMTEKIMERYGITFKKLAKV